MDLKEIAEALEPGRNGQGSASPFTDRLREYFDPMKDHPSHPTPSDPVWKDTEEEEGKGKWERHEDIRRFSERLAAGLL